MSFINFHSEIPDFLHEGEECYYLCGGDADGQCKYCGKKGLCCRQGVKRKDCDGLVGGERRHECTNPEAKGNTKLFYSDWFSYSRNFTDFEIYKSFDYHFFHLSVA